MFIGNSMSNNSNWFLIATDTNGKHKRAKENVILLSNVTFL